MYALPAKHTFPLLSLSRLVQEFYQKEQKLLSIVKLENKAKWII